MSVLTADDAEASADEAAEDTACSAEEAADETADSADEMAEHLNIVLPPSRDYQTLAGLLLAQLQRMPSVGDVVDAQGWRFEVIDIDGRRIDKVLAARMPRRGIAP